MKLEGQQKFIFSDAEVLRIICILHLAKSTSTNTDQVHSGTVLRLDHPVGQVNKKESIFPTTPVKNETWPSPARRTNSFKGIGNQNLTTRDICTSFR